MKCPVCGSSALSEETPSTNAEIQLSFQDWEPGVLQYKPLTLFAERARVCTECGYLLFFAGAERLAKLKRGRPA